jgi:hypothetical protein
LIAEPDERRGDNSKGSNGWVILTMDVSEIGWEVVK